MGKGIVHTVSSLVTRMRKKLRGEEEEIYDLEGTESNLVSGFSPRSSGEDWREMQKRWKEKALMSPSFGGRKMESLWLEKKKEKGRRGNGDGLWRRTIMLGEKCRPLDFEGVIHYDAEGRRLSEPPRSPMRSPLPSFIAATAVFSGGGGNH